LTAAEAKASTQLTTKSKMDKTTGTKGSDVYTATGDVRVDLSVALVRGADRAMIQEGVRAVTKVSLEDAYVMAFHTRNVRGGKGERDLGMAMLQELYAYDSDMTTAAFHFLPHYGCWQDLFVIAAADPQARVHILAQACDQLQEDLETSEGDSISLCAKWAPRENKMPALAKQMAGILFPHVAHFSLQMKKYRQMVSALNKRLDTMEVKMCGGRWAEIVPSKVPGRAGMIYKRALLNLVGTEHKGEVIPRYLKERLRYPGDEDRMACREHFLEHYAKAAKGEAKVHGADTLFPHEVVKKVSSSRGDNAEMDSLRAVWRSMVEKAQAAGGLGRSIFMSDFSGSMQSSGRNGDTPYWVSMALGLLGSEVCAEGFRNRLMTFDSEPRWIEFPEDSDIVDRVNCIGGDAGQGLSTDFQAAMDLVLATLKEKRIRPGQEPENLIVLTDMAWDQACGSQQASLYTGNRYRHAVKTDEWQTHVTLIREAFKRAGEDMWGAGCGFQMPRIVIWNLAAGGKDLHARADTPGVALLSGWSPALFKVIQEAGPRTLTPYEILRHELDDSQYDRIREFVRAWTKL
jgi:hypothetical protein